MKLVQKKTGKMLEAVVELVKDDEWEIIKNSGQFDFNWKKEKDYLVHKIRLELEKEILGLISVEDIPKELRLHIRLIENSNANKGKTKDFDNIAGCLIAHTCMLSFEKNYEGFVSLQPKTLLKDHYMKKYGFRELGQFLFTELENSERLIKKYIGDERI